MRTRVWIIVVLLLLVTGCRKPSTPRPYGYCRIVLPEVKYMPLEGKHAYSFEKSAYALEQKVAHEGKGDWLNLHYSILNADIHCSYMPVHGNLRELTDDAMEFVYKHVSQAHAIPERAFSNDNRRVYGVFFELEGNTASPYQFFLTDSVAHFFRGAAYCNCRPNADSLRPVLDYLETDITHLIETFEWR